MTKDKKSPEALRTIGEVSEHLGVATHVLRFWEGKFSQIKPQKRRGRRYYRPIDIKYLSQVKSLLYAQGYTIRGAQKFLNAAGRKASSANDEVLLLDDNGLSASVLSVNDNNKNIDGDVVLASGKKKNDNKDISKDAVVDEVDEDIDNNDVESLQQLREGLNAIKAKLGNVA